MILRPVTSSIEADPQDMAEVGQTRAQLKACGLDFDLMGVTTVVAQVWPIKLPGSWKALCDRVAKKNPRQAAQFAHLRAVTYTPELIILEPQSQAMDDAFKVEPMLQWHFLRFLITNFGFKGRVEIKRLVQKKSK